MSDVHFLDDPQGEPAPQISHKDAARTLVAFMCCRAGEEFVESELLRPFGYTLEPGPVVRANHNLADTLEQIEIGLDELADRHRQGTVTFEEMLNTLQRTAAYAKRQRENNPAGPA